MVELVSIISPCYNGEKYLIPFMESVLGQTYDRIELIMVDDGSTDNSKEIILSYKDRFQVKGYELSYIYQKNSGAAAAINQGLKVFNGQYLMWVDSDDVLMNNNVSEKVQFLRQNKGKGFVLSQGIVVSEWDYNKKIRLLQRKHDSQNDNLFEDLIYERNVVFGPGCIMVRREAVLKSIPTRKIYESRQGQNWQMMLPLSYYFKCGYIDKPLFKYVGHADSHSRKKKSVEEEIERVNGFIDLLVNTIDSIEDMPLKEKEQWTVRIEEKYMHRRLQVYFRGRKWKEARLEKKKIRKAHCSTWRDSYIYYVMVCVYIKIVEKLQKLKSKSLKRY